MKTEIDEETKEIIIGLRDALIDFKEGRYTATCSECKGNEAEFAKKIKQIFADINNEIGRARLENNIRSTIYHRLDNIKKKWLGEKK